MSVAKYDVFISFKNTDSNGNKTKDSIIAKKLYSYLADKGIKVFFSEAELEFLGKAQYSKVIDDALDSSKFLIAVGCSRENLESEWVRYEWDSFLNEIRSKIKSGGEVFVFYQEMKINDLPRALRGQQAFDATDNLSYERLFNFINNSIGRSNKREYAVYYTHELIDMGRQHLEIEREIENITRKTMAGIDDVEEEWLGNPQQWADVQNEHPKTTRILVCDNKIVGYSFFLFLETEVIEKIKNGSHSDADNNLENIVYADFPGEYPLYFDDIAILQEHRFRGAKVLIDDFVNELIEYAKEGIFITELCSVAFTKQGEDFCKHFQMEITGKSNLGDNVYSLKLLPFPKDSYIAKNYSELKKLYDEKLDHL